MPAPTPYPVARRADQVDDYHGTPVGDPYRWLEDADSAETRAWIEAQNRRTREHLDRIPERAAFRQRLTRLWDHERWGVPVVEGGRYFFAKNDGLQNQAVILVQDSLDGPARVLLDPNPLSPDGTVALTEWQVSRDGKLLAYGLSTGGSDWQEWRIREVDTGRDRPDLLRWVKFSGISFTRDGRGLYYSRYDEPPADGRLREANYFQRLMFHRLGDEQALDTVVYQRPDEKEWGFDGEVTEDGRWLVVVVWRGSEEKHRVLGLDLERAGAGMVELVPDFEASFAFLGSDGDQLYFRTDRGAPRGRVVALDARRNGALREVVAERAETLDQGCRVGQGLVLAYLKDARSDLLRFALDGRLLGAVPLPGLGSVIGISGKGESDEAFFAYTSYLEPTTIFRLDARTGACARFRAPALDFDPAGYETRQVFFASKDGTTVPMFISHRRGIRLDGARPTFLYGYGGFNVSLTPSFSPASLLWMEQGGVFAVANLRGGGEYGEEWHRAGMKAAKQNVFDDFIAAAEWLVASGVTSPARLAIGGGSNGGLLVGACLVQRPDLFAAVVAEVGVFDLLRYQKFTIGWAWVADLGSSDDPHEFEFLRRISPLHNLVPGTRYPSVLIATGDHDDRVVPAHSFKFAAALQAAQGGDGPVLLRVQTRAGHGVGKPTAMVIDEAADRLAFLVDALHFGRAVQGPPIEPAAPTGLPDRSEGPSP